MGGRCTACIAVLFIMHIVVLPVCAGEVEILINKLVEKGILDQDDAADILSEVKMEAAKERKAVIRETTDAILSDKTIIAAHLPRLLRDTTFKGDLRLRYELSERRGKADRHRGRYRLRLGFETYINDKASIGFGLATGSSDPRSTNQSLTNSFETPDIRLDYAFARFKPFQGLTITGGKFKNPLWLVGDYLWDSDIRPEGVTLEYKHSGKNLSCFIVGSYFILDERSNDSHDPSVFIPDSPPKKKKNSLVPENRGDIICLGKQ